MANRRILIGSMKRKRSKSDITDIKKAVDPSKVEEYYSTKRKDFCSSPLDFKFIKNRVRLLNDCNEVKEGKSMVVYYMNREQRVQDNWAMVFAQRLALKYEIPLTVVFCLTKTYMSYSLRHYDFMLRGLKDVHSDLKSLNIPLHVLLGDPVENLAKFSEKNPVSAIVTDFWPLQPHKGWVEELARKIPSDVSLSQVDAHNIIPCWIASEKREYAAKTIRPKIQRLLKDYLTEFPPIIRHEFNLNVDFPGMPNILTEFALEKYFKFIDCDKTVKPLDWAVPGAHQGLIELEKFINERLSTFSTTRNDAYREQTSNLSPWVHFGHLSAQRAILRAMDFKDKYKNDVEVYVEEAVVRRELSENYCYYSDDPESPLSAPNWALETLKKHLKDKREYMYTLEELENSQTHDPIWNASQVKGKMSNYLRMYWGKKVLEWSKNPETALKNIIYLNDKYSIDGNDCNGIVGCMWCVYGLHDRPWRERPIFGYIRYMNEVGCNRHFNVKNFIEKYGNVK